MYNNELKKMILDWKEFGDTSQCLEIIEKFKPLIRKYSYKLAIEDSTEIFTCKLIEVLNTIAIQKDKFTEDKFIVNYISNSIKNEYVNLIAKVSKEQSKMYSYEFSFDIVPHDNDLYRDIESSIFLGDLLKVLNDKEKNIFKSRYIENRSVNETAVILGKTRQCIYMHDKNLKMKLKKYLNQ